MNEHAKQSPKLPVTGAQGNAPEPEVPVFRCVVYMSTSDDGQIQAMAANLPDICVAAASERLALQRIVTQFKKVVIDCKQNGRPIPWIEPPTPIESHQSKRVVPLHL